MYRMFRIFAFGFKALNFLLDLWQTWQFGGGGTMIALITGLIAYFADKPVWFAVVLAIATSILLVCIVSLIFKSFAHKVAENKRLKRLPRLVLDIHKRVCTVRGKLVSKIDWKTIDKDAVMSPLTKIVFGVETEQEIVTLDDATITKGTTKLKEAGSTMNGAPSVLDTYMKTSDTSLENALKKDLWYKVLLARLDSYKPYPNDVIRKCVRIITDSSISFNNVIIYLLYSPQGIELDRELSLKTGISDTTKQQIYITTQNAEKKMNDAIDTGTTNLRTHIRDYLKQESNK